MEYLKLVILAAFICQCVLATPLKEPTSVSWNFIAALQHAFKAFAGIWNVRSLHSVYLCYTAVHLYSVSCSTFVQHYTTCKTFFRIIELLLILAPIV